MRRVQTTISRILLAYMALQVLSGWVILFAIAWCVLEIWRGPRQIGQADQLDVASRA